MIPGVSLAKVGIALVVLAALEAPAAYLWVSRSAVQADLKKTSVDLATANTNLGTTRAQLATSQADLTTCSAAAKASSDSIAALTTRAQEAETLARQFKAKNAQAQSQLSTLIAKRDGQINAASAAKETCDDALNELRAGQ